MSPVYEQAYEPWEGDREPAWRRAGAIVEEGLSRGASSTWVWALWAATLVHVGIRGLMLYNAGQATPMPGQGPSLFTAGFVADTLAYQARWVLLILLAIVASGALSRDINAGAFAFYFSKPITRTGYAIGKVAPSFVLGLTVTAVPALIVWVLGLAFVPTDLYPDGPYMLGLQILAASVIVSLAAALVAVALSGLLRSTALAAGAWVGLGLLSAAAAGILAEVTDRARLEMLDVLGAFNRVQEHVVGATEAGSFTGTAWLVTLAWAAASVGALAYVLWTPEVAG